MLQKAIAEARASGRALTFTVNEVDNTYPWRLSVRYLVLEPNGQEYPRKLFLQCYRTREQAEVVRERLQELEDQDIPDQS